MSSVILNTKSMHKRNCAMVLHQQGTLSSITPFPGCEGDVNQARHGFLYLLRNGITTWVPAGFQASQAETGQVLVAQAGAWLSSWVISYTKDFQLARQKGSIRRNQRRRKKVRG